MFWVKIGVDRLRPHKLSSVWCHDRVWWGHEESACAPVQYIGKHVLEKVTLKVNFVE